MKKIVLVASIAFFTALASITFLDNNQARAQVDVSQLNLDPESFVQGEYIVAFKDGQAPADFQAQAAERAQRADSLIGRLQNAQQDLLYGLRGEKKPETALQNLDDIDTDVGVQDKAAVETFENVYLYDISETTDPTEVIQKYAELDNVAYVEPNYIFYTTVAPNDPDYSSLWGMQTIDAELAWDESTGSNSITVAVIDTGVQVNHPDLQGNALKSQPMSRGCPQNQDSGGHGTHVAGTIGAVGNNSTGVAGVNWTVSINGYGVLCQGGSGSMTTIAAGINQAVADGANVINMSLGGSRGTTMQTAIANAKAAGVTVVVAAGNCGQRPSQSGCGSPPRTISADQIYPASDPNVITVAATNSNDGLAVFSSTGNSVDIAAPGQDILSTIPPTGYNANSGTSMATPHVAGAAALLLSIDSNLSPDQVQNALQCTADDLGSAGWDQSFGHGRLNLKAAVDAVKSGNIPTCSTPGQPTSQPQPTTPPGQPTAVPTTGQGQHPCPAEAEAGNYNCDQATDNNDLADWETDYTTGNRELAPWFEYVRRAVFNR